MCSFREAKFLETSRRWNWQSFLPSPSQVLSGFPRFSWLLWGCYEVGFGNLKVFVIQHLYIIFLFLALKSTDFLPGRGPSMTGDFALKKNFKLLALTVRIPLFKCTRHTDTDTHIHTDTDTDTHTDTHRHRHRHRHTTHRHRHTTHRHRHTLRHTHRHT